MRERPKFLSCLAVLAALSAPALADAHHDEEKDLELSLGAGFGGTPFLGAIGGFVNESSADMSGTASARLRLPRVSPRSLEVYTVMGYGYGLHVRNDDFHIGRLRLHLLDLGVFWDAHKPVSVARVPRTWDITLGLGAEFAVTRRISVTLDWRMFMPLDVFYVLTNYGDYSRLVGEEAVRGGQTWLGASYRW